MTDGLYTRPPRMRHAVLVGDSPLEVSKLPSKKDAKRSEATRLPLGHATVEVLCDRQSILGNPFNMDCLKRSSKHSAPTENEMRDIVCDVFEEFLAGVLGRGVRGSLATAAVATAQRLDYPAEIVGKDWSFDFGTATCEEFRSTFRSLQDLCNSHDGKLRLMCHCAPLRCHTHSFATRLSVGCASASAMTLPGLSEDSQPVDGKTAELAVALCASGAAPSPVPPECKEAWQEARRIKARHGSRTTSRWRCNNLDWRRR